MENGRTHLNAALPWISATTAGEEDWGGSDVWEVWVSTPCNRLSQEGDTKH